MKRIAVILASVAVVLSASTLNASAIVKQKLVIYGDSLTNEAKTTMAAAFSSNPSYTLSIHPQIGLAPCDFLPGATKVLTQTHYALLAIETAGNSQSDCMREPGGCARCYMPVGSPEWEAKCRSDLNALVNLANSTATAVLFISPPPFAGISDSRNDVYNTVKPQLALDHPEVKFTEAPRLAVSNNGTFANQLPCLANETPAMGCDANGMITVRSPDGTHFCPTGFANPCPEYSSGAVRFGTSIATEINTAAGLIKK